MGVEREEVSMSDDHLISLQPGTIVAGRYEVVKCLGAGSMGLVYACRHRELTGHMVAIKVLFPEVARDKVAAARFRNEIFASYNVSHPNVVRAYEYIRDGDLVAYTMEYVGGGQLADKLEGAPIPITEIARLIGQMCLGVQAIHDAGIIHRDLKPENILLTKDGNVKIVDFGIAKAGHGPRLTEHGGVVGTIDYVSPEYMLNSQVDWRSDIYALGILAYEMLTGESPFRGDSVYATMTKRLKSDAKPPSAQRPDCPPELDALVLKAMARDPEKRYQAAVEIFLDLQKLYPDQMIISGAYRQLSATPSTTSRSSTEDAKKGVGPIAGRVPALTVELSSRESSELIDSDTGGGREVMDQGAVASEWDEGEERAPRGWEKTETISAPEARSAHYSKGTVFSPGVEGDEYDSSTRLPQYDRRERILASRPDESQEWVRRPSMSHEVNVATGGIDNSRIRKLSQLADTAAPSVWTDVLILIFAALIGIVVGFVFLNLFFPDVFRRSEVTSVES